MKPMSFLKSAIIVTFLFAGYTQAGAQKAGDYYVQNVIDGDTIELSGGIKVRYIGIDTPETMKRAGTSWLFQPETFGVVAKDFNAGLVKSRNVRLEFDEVKKDKYGRWLAYVYVDDILVNLELVKLGYATVYTIPPNLKHYDELLQAQEKAMFADHGLWLSVKEVSPEETLSEKGKFCSVRGKVASVTLSRGAIYLNYEVGGKNPFRAIIFQRNLPLFAREGIDPVTFYDGMTVEVLGKVEGRDSPEMIIDNPSQIKVL